MEPPCSGLTDLSAYSSQSKSHPKDNQRFRIQSGDNLRFMIQSGDSYELKFIMKTIQSLEFHLEKIDDFMIQSGDNLEFNSILELSREDFVDCRMNLEKI